MTLAPEQQEEAQEAPLAPWMAPPAVPTMPAPWMASLPSSHSARRAARRRSDVKAM